MILYSKAHHLAQPRCLMRIFRSCSAIDMAAALLLIVTFVSTSLLDVITVILRLLLHITCYYSNNGPIITVIMDSLLTIITSL